MYFLSQSKNIKSRCITGKMVSAHFNRAEHLNIELTSKMAAELSFHANIEFIDFPHEKTLTQAFPCQHIYESLFYR